MMVNVAARSAVAALAVALYAAGSATAQSAPPAQSSNAGLCFGFAFGKWTPALDWERAGHWPPLDSLRTSMAPGGRGWAASDVEAQSDTTLLLFPQWWPAGVLVVLHSKLTTPNDTTPGRAIALVADGRKQPSTSPIRAWLVRCQQ
jgi:hypothetical protein